MLHQMPATLQLREICDVPSRTSRWYACQYLRTCRSSLYAIVSCCDSALFERAGLTAGGGRLSGVNVADDDHVDVHLLFTAYIVSGLLMVVGQAGDDLPHVGGCVCVFCGSEVKFCFSAAVLAGCRATS
jgi:hypothetical protein